MATVFTKIIKGEIPCHKIAEDQNHFAFLDINPLTEGHALVIPKQETDYIFNLDDALFSGLHLFSKKIAVAIEKAVECKRIGVAVVGLEVPHAHIHLIPVNEVEDISFARPRVNFTEEELAATAHKIRSFL